MGQSVSTTEEGKNDFMQQIKVPVIACSLALFFLMVLLIPGILTYPEDVSQYDSQKQEDKLLNITKQHNATLRQRIEDLRSALDEGMCLIDGEYLNEDGQLLPSNVMNALPQSPVSVAEACAGALDGEGMSVKELILSSTVFIGKVEEGKIVSMGSGFFIDEQRILTNAHVVDGDNPSKQIYIFSTKFTPNRAQIVEMGQFENGLDPDLAVLAIDSVQNSIPLTFATTEQSSRVRSAGYPGHIILNDLSFREALSNPANVQFDKEPAIGSGYVIIKQEESNGIWLYHDAYIAKGNSGGPLLDKCGRVVGVNTQIQAGTGNVQMPVPKAISLETVEAFFKARNLSPFTISDTPLPEES